MLATGAVAVTLEDNADQPVLEPGVGETPLWGQTRLTGLYPADTDMDGVLAAFPRRLLQQANQRVEILEDKDWEREWMQHYRPMHFGRAPVGMPQLAGAAGSGRGQPAAGPWPGLRHRHPSHHRPVPGGTGRHGAGGLQRRRLRLRLGHPGGGRPETGRRAALGVDNDPQALVASRDNAERNGIAAPPSQVALPGAYDRRAWAQRAAVVIANILAGPAGRTVGDPAGVAAARRHPAAVRPAGHPGRGPVRALRRPHRAAGGERERRLGVPAGNSARIS